MSDIRFRCPKCRGKLVIEKKKALSEVPCPLCGQSITAWGAELLDIRFACPDCRAKLVVDRRVAGSEVDCPRCDRSIRVPDPAAGAPVPRTAVAIRSRVEDLPFPPPSKPLGNGKLSKEEVDFLTAGPPKAAPARPAPK